MNRKVVLFLMVLGVAAAALAFATPSASELRGVPNIFRVLRDNVYRSDYCSRCWSTFYDPQVDQQKGNVHWKGTQSYDLPEVVSPGQQVTFSISFDYVNINSNPAVCFRVYGDWAPGDPLTGGDNDALFADDFGLSPPGQTYTAQVTFKAPTYPGVYRIRWMDHFAYIPVWSFFGGCLDNYTLGPHNWGELLFRVQ